MQRILYEVVSAILRDQEHTRNDDKSLTIAVWWHYNQSAFIQQNGTWYVCVNNIKSDLPSADNIKKIRAKIQNEEQKYKPTDISVLLSRSRSKKNLASYNDWQRQYLNN